MLVATPVCHKPITTTVRELGNLGTFVDQGRRYFERQAGRRGFELQRQPSSCPSRIPHLQVSFTILFHSNLFLCYGSFHTSSSLTTMDSSMPPSLSTGSSLPKASSPPCWCYLLAPSSSRYIVSMFVRRRNTSSLIKELVPSSCFQVQSCNLKTDTSQKTCRSRSQFRRHSKLLVVLEATCIDASSKRTFSQRSSRRINDLETPSSWH